MDLSSDAILGHRKIFLPKVDKEGTNIINTRFRYEGTTGTITKLCVEKNKFGLYYAYMEYSDDHEEPEDSTNRLFLTQSGYETLRDALTKKAGSEILFKKAHILEKCKKQLTNSPPYRFGLFDNYIKSFPNKVPNVFEGLIIVNVDAELLSRLRCISLHEDPTDQTLIDDLMKYIHQTITSAPQQGEFDHRGVHVLVEVPDNFDYFPKMEEVVIWKQEALPGEGRKEMAESLLLTELRKKRFDLKDKLDPRDQNLLNRLLEHDQEIAEKCQELDFRYDENPLKLAIREIASNIVKRQGNPFGIKPEEIKLESLIRHYSDFKAKLEKHAQTVHESLQQKEEEKQIQQQRAKQELEAAQEQAAAAANKILELEGKLLKHKQVPDTAQDKNEHDSDLEEED